MLVIFFYNLVVEKRSLKNRNFKKSNKEYTQNERKNKKEEESDVFFSFSSLSLSRSLSLATSCLSIFRCKLMIQFYVPIALLLTCKFIYIRRVRVTVRIGK